MIEPALSKTLWQRIERHKDHQSFAAITLEGGNNDDLGATAEREGRLRDFDAATAYDDSRKNAAVIAVLNAHYRVGDPRKLTHADVDALREYSKRLGSMASKNCERIADVIESYLPPRA